MDEAASSGENVESPGMLLNPALFTRFVNSELPASVSMGESRTIEPLNFHPNVVPQEGNFNWEAASQESSGELRELSDFPEVDPQARLFRVGHYCGLRLWADLNPRHIETTYNFREINGISPDTDFRSPSNQSSISLESCVLEQEFSENCDVLTFLKHNQGN